MFSCYIYLINNLNFYLSCRISVGRGCYYADLILIRIILFNDVKINFKHFYVW